MGVILDSTLGRPGRADQPCAGRGPREAPHHPRYRRTAVLVPAVIQDGARETACQVVNISASGALIRVPSGALPEAGFAIQIGVQSALAAKVVRRGHDDQWGITFLASPRQVQAVIDRILDDQRANRDQRLFPRRLVMLAGSFYLGDQLVPCRVRNLSVGGAFVKAPMILGPGYGIALRIDRFGTMPAQVIWHSNRGMGASFIEETAVILDRIGHLLPPPPRSSL